MKNKLSLLLLLITFLSFAQNKFVQGYYIDNSGVKTECEILKKKWLNSPNFITIKTNNNETKEINSNEIIEFSIANIKFKKEQFKSEISSINSEFLKYSYKRKFLRVLVESDKHSLYMLQNENYNNNSFYIKNENDTIRELVYKKFESEENKIKVLTYYKQQLLNLNNTTESKQKLNNLNYKTLELIKYIKNISPGANNSSTKIYLNKDSLQVKFKFGVYNYFKSHSFYLSGNIDQEMNFSSQNMYGVTSEIEFTPSILNRNYAVFLEYGFDLNEYKDQTDIVRPVFINPNYHIEYSIKNQHRSYIGLRRYFKINSNLNLNISSKIAINEKYKGHLYVERDIDRDFTVKQNNFVISTGVEYKNILLEFNYVANTTLDASNYLLFSLKYNLFRKHLKYTSLN